MADRISPTALIETALQLTAPGKGILASDESPSTLGKRLARHGLSPDIETRRRYRDLFYTAPGIGEAISGAILFPEALLQSSSDGVPFVNCLLDRGVLPGVKVDEGLRLMADDVKGALNPGETTTAGLDGLFDRCQTYRQQGARFAKWRAALKICGDGVRGPSEAAIEANARQLAEYAATCQASMLVVSTAKLEG
jgi:fructose-bisphosphate aldolase, class I